MSLIFFVAEDQICIYWHDHRDGCMLQIKSLRGAKPHKDRKSND